MNLLHKITGIIFTLFSLPSAAVLFSTPVSEDDYENHVVRFTSVGTSSTYMNTCTGLLAGGRYLLTASHCLHSEHYDPIKVTIYQGNYTFKPTASHEVIGTTLKPMRSYYANLASRYYWADILTKWTIPAFTNVANHNGLGSFQKSLENYRREIEYLLAYSEADKNNPVMQHHGSNDFGLVILNESIPHHTNPILSGLIDMDTGHPQLSHESEFQFRGYGRDVQLSLSTPETLKEGTFRMYRPYLKSHTLVSNGFPPYGTARLDMCEEDATECFFRPQTLIDLIGIDTGEGYPSSYYGDSGGPIVSGDYYFGSMYGTDNATLDGKVISLFSDLTYIMDWLADELQDVLYPSDPGKTITKGEAESHEIKIPIQNFTSAPVLVGPAVVSEEAFTIISDCEGLLGSTSGCMIKLLFNSSLSTIDSEIFTTIDIGVNGADSLPLSIRFPSADTPDTPEIPDISCDEYPLYPGCYDICDVDWYAPGCPPIECSVDPYQDKCIDTCERFPDSDECSAPNPTDPTDNVNGGSGSIEDSGGSLGLSSLLIGLMALWRRKARITKH